MIRDEEIERLKKYAQGMGLRVTFSNARSSESVAEWSIDGTEITIYVLEHTSKTGIILSMIHELAHHLWFVHEKDRQLDLKFEEAVDREMMSQKTDKPMAKRFRRRIYEMENASTAYWESIYKETDLGIPKWKLYRAMEFDVWQYEVYFKDGKFPTRKKLRAKARELTAKHKGIAYE